MPGNLITPQTVAGRDAKLPGWMMSGEVPPERPHFDSVLVRGSGIGALVCAARLARSESFAGRVTLAGPVVRETRRLYGGLTLRARSLDYYGAALGRTRRELLDEIFPSGDRPAETRLQVSSVAAWREARVELLRSATTMHSRDHGDRVLAYGARNSQIGAALQRSMAKLDLHWHDGLPESLAECRDLAVPGKVLVIDADARPLVELTASVKGRGPRWQVVASQLHFADPDRARRGLLPDAATFLGMIRRERALDVGVYSPVLDPLSPAARWYGVFFRIVRRDPGFRAEDERVQQRENAVAVGRAMGLEPVDEDEVRAEAVLPCAPWSNVTAQRADVLELHRIYSAGVPIITGCGMARAGLAGLVAAESVIAGEDPVRHTNRALSEYRKMNRAFAVGMTRLPRLAAAAYQRLPESILTKVVNQPDMWAGLE